MRSDEMQIRRPYRLCWLDLASCTIADSKASCNMSTISNQI
jgi:hypothetical protein